MLFRYFSVKVYHNIWSSVVWWITSRGFIVWWEVFWWAISSFILQWQGWCIYIKVFSHRYVTSLLVIDSSTQWEIGDVFGLMAVNVSIWFVNASEVSQKKQTPACCPYFVERWTDALTTGVMLTLTVRSTCRSTEFCSSICGNWKKWKVTKSIDNKASWLYYTTLCSIMIICHSHFLRNHGLSV